MNTAITVKNLSKIYTISHEKAKYKSLRDEAVNLLQHPLSVFSEKKEKFYALRDVSFSLNEGETLGVIGPNGSGKSTLLKILSRITQPSAGEIRLRGRVSSLLEVGTGFHPELTGRENIFLSGAVLGMAQKEIKRKFDEIINFAGVEKFLDTPVKHYSSGMYTRLAFSVAAFLEPEILLVDEVLAVGDTEFQKKCIAKMKEETKEGRTIIFVSHNMGAISNLCNKCILLERGKIKEYGPTAKIVSSYLSESSRGVILKEKGSKTNNSQSPIIFSQVSLRNSQGKATTEINYMERFCIRILATVTRPSTDFTLNLTINGAAGNPLYNSQITPGELGLSGYAGEVEFDLDINPNIFGTGTFSISLTCDYEGTGMGYSNLLTFTISNESNFKYSKFIMYDSYVVYPRNWSLKRISARK